MAQLNANLSNYDAQEGFDALPPGWYMARIADSEIKQGPKGAYINWVFEIQDKPNKIWDVMSLGNEVSLKRLKTLAQSAGHPNPNYIADTEELHGLKVLVKLKIEKSEEYGDKNKVSAFKSPEASKQPNNKPAASTQSSGEPASGNPASGTQAPEKQKVKMPWEK